MAAKTTGSVELCYIDCFAGPWGDPSEGMESTSIAISLRTLDGCRQELGRLGISAKIRALYIEEDAAAFARLKAYLTSNTPTSITSTCIQGDFVSLRKEIVNWAGSGGFAFFFIDPKGWKQVGVGTLRPLMQRQRSEFLVNFMYNDINRLASMPEWQPDFTELVGQTLDLTGLSPVERERLLLRTYRENLKRNIPNSGGDFRPRSAHVRVLDPSKERPKYHLVYVTSHPKGIIEFLEISDDVDLIQKQVRAEKKDSKRQKESGIEDMFGASSLIDHDAGHGMPEDVDQFWCTYLHGGPRKIDRSVFADILEEKDWFPSDLQASLVRLIKAGKIRNHSANASRRHKRPLHFEISGGEQLEMVKS
jgi:three-Cys-motif partner protein